MPIAALDEAAAKAIGSASALYDPCCVVKELVDNALDANATIVSIELSSNTLDTIQVKDNGLGIPLEDRDLVCKRNHTSKIRSLEDLKNVGGSSLGFRGQALASTAEMQVMLKSSTQNISRIRRTLQEYALSRVHVRFSLKILKHQQDSAWVYAPKQNPSVTDAISKIIGVDVMAQCLSQTTDLVNNSIPNRENESHSGIRLHAILPKLDAVKIYKSYIKYTFERLPSSTVANPFLCLYIFCAEGSYDVNIEPSKDDVLFENQALVSEAVEGLFEGIYGKLQSRGENQVHSQMGASHNLHNPDQNLFLGLTPSKPLNKEQTRLATPFGPTAQQLECNSTSRTNRSTGRIPNTNPWSLAKRSSAQRCRASNSSLLTPSPDSSSPIVNNVNPQTNYSSINGYLYLGPSPSSRPDSKNSPVKRTLPAIETQHAKRQGILSQGSKNDGGPRPERFVEGMSTGPLDRIPKRTAGGDSVQQPGDADLGIPLAARFGDPINTPRISCPTPKPSIETGKGDPRSLGPSRASSNPLHALHPPPFSLEKSIDFERKHATINLAARATNNNHLDLSLISKGKRSGAEEALLVENDGPCDDVNRMAIRYPSPMPDAGAVHHLAVSCNTRITDIEPIMRQLWGVDSFIQTGKSTPKLVLSCPAKVIEHWKATTLNLVRKSWHTETAKPCITLNLP
ncbi:predicted protein [Uncinocarpus reesii 1704]|uniref:DNA mismatch repair protein S5 domain-containing protein n=1 Tax=Uncinocarpus reesii (strain UAMH 1704) TaxID=336963 RepID=C4JHN1_UNCRE|nr:uncharacterized protein UREG_02717 [Uncinocarpus reesii 1704]EEP77868.1 predicted protein [Uncinocarpus reesii 1704]